MTPHAEYHSTYPLPICGTIHGQPARTINPPPAHCVRRVVQDMGEVRSYPKTRKPRYSKRDRAAAETKRRKAIEAKLREATYAFMAGKDWMTAKTIADMREADVSNVRRSIAYLVADKVVQKKMLGNTALYRWVKK